MVVIPFGDMAMRMNLLSAFFASLVAVMIYLINRVLNHGRLTAALSSAIAAFSFTFWSHAVITEVYTLAALFFCLLIFFTLLWLKEKKPKWLLLLALTAGLGLAHHVIIAVFYPVFLLFVLVTQPRLIRDWKLVVKMVALFLLPLLLYLYLPLRSAADPVNDWGNPETFSALTDHITARQFGGLFFKHGFEGVKYQLNIFMNSLLDQFHFVVLLLVLFGVMIGLKREKRAVFLFLALLAVNISYASAYFITDIEPQFIYLFLVLALFAGMALEYVNGLILKTGNPRVLWPGWVVLAIIALLPLVLNWAKCDHGNNYLARNYGQNMMASLDEKGVLFIDSEAELFIVAYLKIVEGLRPDVEVYDVRQNIFFIPAMKEKNRDEVTVEHLYRFAQQMVTDKRPVYFSNPIFGNFRFTEHGVLYRALPGGESPDLTAGKTADPWDKYDLSGLDRPYLNAGAKEMAGKYYLSRAKVLAMRGKVDESLAFLDKAVKVAADQHQVLKQTGMFYMQVRRHDLAEGLLKKAVKLNPFDSDDYNMLGMIAHYRKDYMQALADYDKAIELRENHITALMNRGILYEQMGDKETDKSVRTVYYRSAHDDMERSKKIEPKNPVVTQVLNRVSMKLSRQ
jgi:tetratricopeptide (TPR) repeat protein